MKKIRPAEIYFRFLRLADALRELSPLPDLDPLEERMLVLIGRAQQEELRLSVRDMMARQEFGAPATIHSRLKSMRKKGWITLADTHDARRKQVELTPAALLHFDRLSQCMRRAASSMN